MDGGDAEVIARIAEVCPDARILQSATLLGPGGSRNRLVAEASSPWVASFDDDAWPLSPDYFATATRLIHDHADAAILGASNLPDEWQWPEPMQIAVYHGYACLFNQAWFLRSAGFVPLPFAYCMEEVDIGLRLHALGGRVLQSPQLRVVHEADPPSNSPTFHRRALANIALFLFLRYPFTRLPLALAHLMRRLAWLLGTCPAAILPGLLSIPRHLWTFRHHRQPVSPTALHDWLHLRRHPRRVKPCVATPS